MFLYKILFQYLALPCQLKIGSTELSSVSDNEIDTGEKRKKKKNWYLWSSTGENGLFKYQPCLQNKILSCGARLSKLLQKVGCASNWMEKMNHLMQNVNSRIFWGGGMPISLQNYKII